MKLFLLFPSLLSIFLFTLFSGQLFAGEGCNCQNKTAGGYCTGNSATYERDNKKIEFHFDCDGGACACGRFATDWDYWVSPKEPHGSVNITRITPDITGSGDSLRNGAMIDPKRMDRQAFHGGSINNNILFRASMNELFSPPETLTPQSIGRPSVIIKSIARDDSFCQNPDRQCIEYYETLTVLQEPPGNVFRPPYFGEEKPMIPGDSFDFSVLSNHQGVSNLISWEEALSTVRSPNIAPMTPFRAPGQGLHARINNQRSRGYDGYVIQQLNAALLMLTVDPGTENHETKRQLALGVAQMGIDLFHIHKNGAASDYSGYGDFTTVPCGAWPAAGGFNGGRITPIIFASVLLGQDDWLERINSNLSSRDGLQCFAETGFIQRNDERRGKGIPTFGHLNTSLYFQIGDCDGHNRNCASVGGRSEPDYRFYDGLADGDPLSSTGSPTSYQQCCTLNAWFGAAVATWLTPEVMRRYPENARHWLSFMERSKRLGDDYGDGHFGSYSDPQSFSVTAFRATAYESRGAVEMWAKYRDCIESGTCGSRAPRAPVLMSE